MENNGSRLELLQLANRSIIDSLLSAVTDNENIIIARRNLLLKQLRSDKYFIKQNSKMKNFASLPLKGSAMTSSSDETFQSWVWTRDGLVVSSNAITSSRSSFSSKKPWHIVLLSGLADKLLLSLCLSTWVRVVSLSRLTKELVNKVR
jgi:hypothetical protein